MSLKYSTKPEHPGGPGQLDVMRTGLVMGRTRKLECARPVAEPEHDRAGTLALEQDRVGRIRCGYRQAGLVGRDGSRRITGLPQHPSDQAMPVRAAGWLDPLDQAGCLREVTHVDQCLERAYRELLGAFGAWPIRPRGAADRPARPADR